MAEVAGTCAPRFDAVRRVFEASLRARREPLGAAVAVVVGGEPVVDLWGGHADLAGTRAWQADTLACIYSATKGLTALCALRLAEQGALDLDAPVAACWPEFGGHGKQAITVGCVLGHRAGLAAIRQPLAIDAVYDWDTMVDVVAGQTPEWPPDQRHGYHALTFGWLVGEVIRRVTGLTVGAYLRTEIAGPLGLDLHLGVPRADQARTAELSPLPAPSEPVAGGDDLARSFRQAPGSLSARAFLNPPTMLRPSWPRWMAAELPAVNGFATARALAGVYGILAAGGSSLLGRVGLERCRAIASAGLDEVLRIPTRFSLGFMRAWPAVMGEGAFGHVGAGGSVGFADPDAGIGFGYVTNHLGARLLVDPRPQALVEALYASVRTA